MRDQSHDFVIRHFLDALVGGIAESNGNKALARRLQAQTKLRLVTMSEAEMKEYARFVEIPPNKTYEKIYLELQNERERLRKTASEWLVDLQVPEPEQYIPTNQNEAIPEPVIRDEI